VGIWNIEPVACILSGIDLEDGMKQVLAALCMVGILGVPMVSAQTDTKQLKGPGQSEYAPGQRADQPGDAKTYAPGQMRKENDNTTSPGASEYAPGQQSGAQKPNEKPRERKN
jgi:hypothetical protein